jgi:hypothetical protein
MEEHSPKKRLDSIDDAVRLRDYSNWRPGRQELQAGA